MHFGSHVTKENEFFSHVIVPSKRVHYILKCVCGLPETCEKFFSVRATLSPRSLYHELACII